VRPPSPRSDFSGAGIEPPASGEVLSRSHRNHPQPGAKFFEDFSLRTPVDDGMNTFMNQSDSFKRSNQNLLKSQKQSRAFTLTELVVVIATIAVLAMVVLPALAGTANKGGRAQCANNLRQIGVASMMYAAEYKDWLPINQVHTGSANVNKLNGMNYTYYVVSPSGLGTPNTFIPTNSTSVLFSDLGLLYRAGLAGNGSIFYCPEQWGTPSGANLYSPLLTSDSSGNVRSSYSFNPRTLDPTNGVFLRRYQKTGDLEPHKLLAVDYFAISLPPAAPSHFRERGWNVLFTDGSVQFSQGAAAYGSIQNFVVAQTIQSQEQEDFILNCLEFDH
jgi:type II secretory pathway pseudopilin PulG